MARYKVSVNALSNELEKIIQQKSRPKRDGLVSVRHQTNLASYQHMCSIFIQNACHDRIQANLKPVPASPVRLPTFSTSFHKVNTVLEKIFFVIEAKAYRVLTAIEWAVYFHRQTIISINVKA